MNVKPCTDARRRGGTHAAGKTLRRRARATRHVRPARGGASIRRARRSVQAEAPVLRLVQQPLRQRQPDHDSQRQPATAGSSSMRRRLCRPASRPRLRPNRRHVPNLADLHAIPLEVPQPARREPPRERHAPLQQRAQVRRQNGSPRHARCPCPQAVPKSEPAKRHCGHGSGAIAQNGEGRHRAGPRLA